jgi:hypothetical protein
MSYGDIYYKRGFFVEIVTSQQQPSEYYRILASEPLKYRTNDDATTAEFSYYSPGTGSGPVNIKNLEPPQTPIRLYQVLFGFRTGGKYRVKIPTGVTRFGVDNQKELGYLTIKDSPWFAPNPDYMFWLLYNYYPSIEFSNTCAYTVAPCVYFTGKKYDIVQVTSSGLLAALDSGQQASSRVVIGGVALS